jgi:hypothetical protein
MPGMKSILIAFVLLVAVSLKAEDPVRPDPRLTPGAILSGVTVEQIMQRGYTRTVRSVPASVKREVFAHYFGRVPGMPGHYEIDHLISLELGGSNDPKNLWPESYYTEPFNAHVNYAAWSRLERLKAPSLVSSKCSSRTRPGNRVYRLN